MKRFLWKSLTALAACAPLLAVAAWPDRPIRMVVPYAAGGGADSTARIVAQQVSAALGQPIIIDKLQRHATWVVFFLRFAVGLRIASPIRRTIDGVKNMAGCRSNRLRN